MGIPAHPRRTHTTRPPTRSVHRMEDPPRSGHRPDPRPNRAHMVIIHPVPIQSNNHHRLRLRRHRPPETLPCPVRHRTQHTKGAPGRSHDQPNRAVDDPSCTKPLDATERASSVPIPDSRRSRTIHRILRHSPRRIGHHHNPYTTTIASANAFAERWVRTLRHELLDRTIIWNERQLRRLLEEYIEHYNIHRPYRSLHQRAPNDTNDVTPIGPGHPIQRHSTCSGLINEYRSAA